MENNFGTCALCNQQIQPQLLTEVKNEFGAGLGNFCQATCAIWMKAAVAYTYAPYSSITSLEEKYNRDIFSIAKTAYDFSQVAPLLGKDWLMVMDCKNDPKHINILLQNKKEEKEISIAQDKNFYVIRETYPHSYKGQSLYALGVFYPASTAIRCNMNKEPRLIANDIIRKILTRYQENLNILQKSIKKSRQYLSNKYLTGEKITKAIGNKPLKKELDNRCINIGFGRYNQLINGEFIISSPTSIDLKVSFSSVKEAVEVAALLKKFIVNKKEEK